MEGKGYTWAVYDAKGLTIGFSHGNTYEEAFYNFENGSLLLREEHVTFVKLKSVRESAIKFPEGE